MLQILSFNRVWRMLANCKDAAFLVKRLSEAVSVRCFALLRTAHSFISYGQVTMVIYFLWSGDDSSE